MGLLDKIFNRRTEETKPQREEPQYQYSMPSQRQDEDILVYDIKEEGKVRHRNNEITKLIMARITNYREGDTLYFDASDYIGFELPEGQQIDQTLMEEVMRVYERERKQGQNSYYIGRATQENGYYSFESKSAAVEKMVENIVQKDLQDRQARYERERQRREERDKEYREKVSQSAKAYMEMKQKELDKRKAHPFLQTQELGSGYDGVNINTGDILRIRNIVKVGKDGSGTYLYSAYIYNTSSQQDVEFFDQTIGYPVCFELSGRLEDMVKAGDARQIQTILQLLSNPKNFENMDKLSYIGEIDKNGQAHRNLESSSSAIRAKIASMQREFAQRKQEEKRRQQEQK